MVAKLFRLLILLVAILVIAIYVFSDKRENNISAPTQISKQKT